MDAEKIETNTPKAYIHFERATAVAFFHNSREAFLPQTSYEELRGKNICDRTAAEARALYKKLDEQADAAFLAKSGRRTNMKENALMKLKKILNINKFYFKFIGKDNVKL